MIRPNAHSAYLSPNRPGGASGISDMSERYRRARVGSEMLLAALVRYFERRKAA